MMDGLNPSPWLKLPAKVVLFLFQNSVLLEGLEDQPDNAGTEIICKYVSSFVSC